MATEFFPLPDSTSNLSVEVRTLDNGPSLRVSGELDFFNVRGLNRAFETIELDGRRRVILDLTGLTFCDAAGVAALLKAHRSLHSAGGQLVIRGASGLPRRVLTITGADRVLELE